MLASNLATFLFEDGRRKLFVVGAALLTSQTVALALAGSRGDDAYVLTSLVAFFFAVTGFAALYPRFTKYLARRRECRDDESIRVLDTEFECLYDSDLSRLIKHKRLAVTGAAEEIIGALTRELVKLDPASITFIDSTDHGVESRVRFFHRFAPDTLAEKLSVNIADYSALRSEIGKVAPHVILDAAIYRFLHTKFSDPKEVAPENLVSFSIAGFERVEAAANLVDVWCDEQSIESVLLLLPSHSSQAMKRNWTEFYSAFLHAGAREVGAHLLKLDADAVLSVWRPVRDTWRRDAAAARP